MTPDNIQWTRGVMINDVSWSQTVNESDLPLTDSTSTFLNRRGLKWRLQNQAICFACSTRVAVSGCPFALSSGPSDGSISLSGTQQ